MVAVTLYDILASAVEDSGYRLSPSETAGKMDQELADWREPSAFATEKVVTSRIRVQLSRPLTWAEKEALETNYVDEHLRRVNESGTGVKLHLNSARTHVWAEAHFGSRILFEIVSAALEQHFVNVYPTAVRTFREYNGE